MASSQPRKAFTFHPSVAKFNTSVEDLLTTLNSQIPTPLDFLATGSIVFGQHHEPGPPRILLVQRASTDSFPNRWEVPGGAVDAGETVLAGCAREVYEESGLVVKRILGLVVNDMGEAQREKLQGGDLFTSSRGKRILKFTFLVEVEDSTAVKLDPNEHQDYLWATEEECRAKKAVRSGGDGRGNVDLEFTLVEQEAVILKSFTERKKSP